MRCKRLPMLSISGDTRLRHAPELRVWEFLLTFSKNLDVRFAPLSCVFLILSARFFIKLTMLVIGTEVEVTLSLVGGFRRRGEMGGEPALHRRTQRGRWHGQRVVNASGIRRPLVHLCQNLAERQGNIRIWW
jgi:hypothetical protein